jgi:NDP-sugar pyrophosphorylase family protein
VISSAPAIPSSPRARVHMPTTFDYTPENTPAVLLVGGQGTRLQSVVSGRPKPLATVGNLPFLELLILQLRAYSIRKVVMCTGYLADQIEEQFGDGDKWGVSIEYSREVQPLGTAGALKFAERFLSEAPEFLVMNGDSFLEMDLYEFIRFHREHSGLVSMAIRAVPNSARFGTVQIDRSHRVVEFVEKAGAAIPGVVSGGVYVFDRAALKLIPKQPASLEKDVFPSLLDRGVFALEQHGLFIDIGTPEDYARAQELCSSLYRAAVRET